MRGIAEQHGARPRIIHRILQFERKARHRGGEFDVAEHVAARRFQSGGEFDRVELAQPRSLGARGAPYDGRSAVGQRQEGQRPGGQESLPSGVPVRFARAHMRHQGILMIGMAGAIDAEQSAGFRFGAVGRDQQSAG